jgi:hypothetical protein
MSTGDSFCRPGSEYDGRRHREVAAMTEGAAGHWKSNVDVDVHEPMTVVIRHFSLNEEG